MVRSRSLELRGIETLRHLSLPMTSILIVAVSTAALLGWWIGYGLTPVALRNSVPMHPTTTVLLMSAAVSLWLCGGSWTPVKSKFGVIFGGIVLLGGISRLLILLCGAAPWVDRHLYPSLPTAVQGVSPVRFTMAPATSLGLILFGAALICMHCRRDKFRLLIYILTLIPALMALLTFSRCLFLNVGPLGVGLQNYPIALSAAICFLLLTVGIWVELTSTTQTLISQTQPNTASSQRKKLTVGFSAAVLVLLGVGIFSHQSMAEFIEDSRWDNHTHQVLAVISKLYASFKDAEGAERGFIITGDSSFLKTRYTSFDEIFPSFTALEEMTADNAVQQRRLRQLKPLIQAKMEIVENLTAIRREKGFEDAKQLLSTGPAVAVMDKIQTLLAEMTSEENRLLAERMASTQTNARRGMILISFSAAFALMLVLTAGWMINRDIGARERAEEALRASETLFRGLLQSAPDAIVITNKAGIIELVNARAEQLFGYTAGQLIGKPIETIIPAGIKDVLPSDPSLTGLRRDGSKFPADITHNLLEIRGGTRVSSAIRDATQQRDEEHRLAFLNSALSESNSQLEAANKELESFSYSVSHDLRAPLRSIDGFSQAVLEDYEDKLDLEGRDHLHRVRAATQRMGQLIDDLLNLSRVTRLEINREQVDLTKIARDIADELRSAHPDHDVQLVVADGLNAYTDARLIRIVLTNLLSNAWKFTSKKKQARIEFGCNDQSGKPNYFVNDNGAGFDPAYTSRLFGAFQRLHSASEYAGTGIGLATVQRIVRRQGGDIWAEGQLDQGATFHFTL